MKLPYTINLIGCPHDGPNDVVTRDGEIIGTWRVDDETDAFFEFIPEGESEPCLSAPFVSLLCDMILDWRSKAKP